MKKTLGSLVLILSALVTACASSGASSSQPTPTQPDPDQWPGQYMAKAGPSDLPNRTKDTTAEQTTSLASR